MTGRMKEFEIEANRMIALADVVARVSRLKAQAHALDAGKLDTIQIMEFIAESNAVDAKCEEFGLPRMPEDVRNTLKELSEHLWGNKQ